LSKQRIEGCLEGIYYLLKFAGAIEAEDITIIEKVIHEGCEKVNLDEW
jgi:hypothetical protein